MLGSDFVSGAITFIDEWDDNARIVIRAKFDGKPVLAIVDTASPYCVLAPDKANEIGIDRTAGHQLDQGFMTRFGRFNGWLCRIPVTLEAQMGLGSGVEFETTVFIPDGEWPDDKNFIGLTNCLFRIRFALDPQTNLFYFSEPI